MVLVEVSAPERFRSSPRGKVVVSSGNDEEAEGSVSRCLCERVREREAEREREREYCSKEETRRQNCIIPSYTLS